MDLKKLIWVFSAVFCVCVLAAAEKDFSKIEIEEYFRPFLTAKKRFMKFPGVRIFSTPDRKGKMIISVASVASKGSSGKAYADMIKIGRI